MSKNNPQEAEAQEEPEYLEPTYDSTIGKKERDLNDDALLQLVENAKTKKGKKNRRERQNESKNTEKEKEKKKKIIIDDPSQLKDHINFAKTPSKPVPKNDEKNDFTQLSQAQYKNTAILATVSGQIEESDISRFFNNISIYKIHPEPGYFIIEFSTEEDLHKALQKNKTPYQNNITVLVGEYSIEDEDPKPEKHDFPKPYASSRYNYDDEDYQPTSKISLGAKSQQQTTELPRQSYQNKPTSGFRLGSKVQQQTTESTKPAPPPYKPLSSKAYVPPKSVNNGESKLPFGKQENLKPIETSNSFGILKDDS